MQSFVMALRSISANKMRAVLTMLGIIIGVMALVVLVSLVNGATNSVTSAVSDLGSSSVTVTISDDKGKPVTLEDLDNWMEREPGMGELAPYTTASLVGRHGANYGTVTVYGTTPAYYNIQAMQLSMGRWLKDVDISNNSYVCIITENTAEELIGYTDCVGQTLSLGGVEYSIVGVLQDDEDSLTSILTSGSLMAYIPYTSLIRLSDSVVSDVTTFYISAPEGGSVEQADETIERILLERFDQDEDAFNVSTSAFLEEAMDDITSVLSVLLGGIAAISLVVGGIGIMNIMMVTVTERTREIGIRKAIGASRGTILTQFLMEAVVLCMMGCGLGIFLSWAILQVVSTVVASTGIVFTLDGGVVLLAVIFCFIIGVVFGMYPANKAAKMKPIDALHYGG
ncbi:MAG: ABC transporter permease [Oscillospiraceae bacterium]|nr:ABC transporter permease [Oscillospiraceae bacterium]